MNSKVKQAILNYFPVLLGLISGFSVFYFLYFFKAYGIQTEISYSGHSHLFRSISFGLLTFVYLTILEAWIKPRLALKNFKHLLLWYLGLVFLGSQLIFLLFNYFWNMQEWNVEAYLLIMKEFPLMMIIPLLFYMLINVSLRSTNVADNYVVFRSDSGKDLLKIKLEDFLYANSAENYVTIHYLSGNKNKQHLIRKPLKVLEDELSSYPGIIRSHRSYLVNLQNIQNMKQSRGKTFIEISTTTIPVSKTYKERLII